MSISEVRLLAIAMPKDDVGALAVPCDMPVEHLGERLRFSRCRLGGFLGNNMPGRLIQSGQPLRTAEGRQHIAKALSLAEQLFGKVHREATLDAEQEFRA